MDCLDRDLQDSYCCGADQCVRALQLGAVQSLLLSESCSRSEELRALASATRASTVTVSPTTAAGHRFCQGIETGALLRWPIAELDLEDWCKDTKSDASTTDEDSEIDGSDAETEAENPYGELTRWLIPRLCETGMDRSASDAEALACCVSVMLELSEDAVEQRVELACELLRNEGVCEQLLHQMAARIIAQHGLFED
jgi:hypothetical protein